MSSSNDPQTPPRRASDHTFTVTLADGSTLHTSRDVVADVAGIPSPIACDDARVTPQQPHYTAPHMFHPQMPQLELWPSLVRMVHHQHETIDRMSASTADQIKYWAGEADKYRIERDAMIDRVHLWRNATQDALDCLSDAREEAMTLDKLKSEAEANATRMRDLYQSKCWEAATVVNNVNASAPRVELLTAQLAQVELERDEMREEMINAIARAEESEAEAEKMRQELCEKPDLVAALRLQVKAEQERAEKITLHVEQVTAAYEDALKGAYDVAKQNADMFDRAQVQHDASQRRDERERAEMTATLDALHDERDTLASRLHMMTSERDTLIDDLLRVSEERAAAEKMTPQAELVATLRSSIEYAENARDEFKAQAIELGQQLTSTRERMRVIDAEREEMTARLKTLSDQVANGSQEVALRYEVETLRNALTSCADQLASATRQLDALNYGSHEVAAHPVSAQVGDVTVTIQTRLPNDAQTTQLAQRLADGAHLAREMVAAESNQH